MSASLMPSHFQPSWERKRLATGEFIYQPADTDTHIYLIEKGLVKLGSLGPLGERVIYDLLQPGETFGDLDYLAEAEFFEFAQAATNLVLLTIERAAFRYAVSHDQVIAEWFNEAIVRRWHKAECRLLHRTCESVDSRINRLQGQFVQAGYTDQTRCLLDVLTHQEIGDLIGTTRQTVSKKLKTQQLTHAFQRA